MDRTGDGRPDTVGRRDIDHAGSGTTAARRQIGEPVGRRDREPLPTRVTGLPELPPAYRSILEHGLDRLGVHLDPGVARAVDDHVRFLYAWNAAVNLTAIRDPADAAREHVLDSLSALALLRARRIDAFVDLGSGGGFPGIPLALALPARRCLLVESIGKKARFLEAAVAAIGASRGLAARNGEAAGGETRGGAGTGQDDPATGIRVATERAEALASQGREREAWPAVLARAVAPLPELAELAFPLLSPGGVLVAWKRLPVAGELAAARPALAVLGGGPLEVFPSGVEGLEDHVLVVASKIHPTPADFPRSPSERRHRPL